MRPGVAEYIRRYDTVRFRPPTSFAGMVYEQNVVSLEEADGPPDGSPASMPFNNYRFVTPEQFSRYVRRPMWRSLPADIHLRDEHLVKAMRSFGVWKFPTSFVFFEGTYLARPLAERIVSALLPQGLEPDRRCEDPAPYPASEIYVATLLQHYCEAHPGRCGERVSTMLWRTVEDETHELWTATLLDVVAVRSSPFAVPFSIKRIPRNVSDPVRRFIMDHTATDY